MNCGVLFSQGDKVWCLDSADVLQVRKDYNKLAYLESKDTIQEAQIQNLKKQNGVKDTIINLQAMQLKERDGQIELFKQREARLEIPPVLRWRGFFPGISVAYRFDSEVITQQTVIAGLRYDLTGSFKVEALGKFDMTGQIFIPLRKESFGLKVFVEYKLF